jgi:hypothetical protein
MWESFVAGSLYSTIKHHVEWAAFGAQLYPSMPNEKPKSGCEAFSKALDFLIDTILFILFFVALGDI